MNTQSHAILTYVMLRPFLSKSLRGTITGTTSLTSGRINTAIFLGALCPDLPIYLFFGWYTFVERASQRLIWGEYYFLPHWQTVFDFSHSFPLWIAGLLASISLKRRTLWLFMAAGLLASAQDILLHFDDGHSHFFPFSSYRFASPVSYWDPAHHGTLFSTVEAIVVTFAAIWTFPRLQSRWGKAFLIVGLISLWGVNSLWSTIFQLL